MQGNQQRLHTNDDFKEEITERDLGNLDSKQRRKEEIIDIVENIRT